ncbi:MAG: cyclic nucleotide-binding domain-containing protein [Desulfobacterales bacterium]|nr:cyclic nucleotide-binding domain-containing protein [Desulfobacterales bacterium]
MVNLDFLKKAEVFNGLDDDQLTAVQGCCDIVDFQSGAKIFGEGDDADYLWIVIEGQVDIRFDLPGRPTSEDSNISSVSEAMTFGWSSLVPPNTYKLSAYCASRTCKLVRIAKKCLTDIFEKDSRTGYQVMRNVTVVVGRRFHDLQGTAAAPRFAKVDITVHLATCGIAAGAREVMNTLMEEIDKSGRKDVKVATGRCLGRCPTEPNVTVKIEGEDPVVYQLMNPDKMQQIFKNHVLKGEVQTDFVLVQA